MLILVDSAHQIQSARVVHKETSLGGQESSEILILSHSWCLAGGVCLREMFQLLAKSLVIFLAADSKPSERLTRRENAVKSEGYGGSFK